MRQPVGAGAEVGSAHRVREEPRVCSAFLHRAPGTLCPHRSAAQAGILALGHAGLGHPDTSPSQYGRLQGAWQRGLNVLMLGLERCLAASLLRSIETQLPSTVAQPGSSIIHPRVWASRAALRSHLCIAGLARPPPAPGLAPTQAGGMDPCGSPQCLVWGRQCQRAW